MGAAESGPPAERGPGAQPSADDVPDIFARELWDPRVQCKYWLAGMSQAIDAWMRSVAFLEFMQHGLQMAIAAKRLRDHWSMNSLIEPHVEAGTADGRLSSLDLRAIPRGAQGKGNTQP